MKKNQFLNDNFEIMFGWFPGNQLLFVIGVQGQTN